MSDTGSVLPQEEIDAIFKQATGKSLGVTVPEKPGNTIPEHSNDSAVPTPVPASNQDNNLMRQVLDKLETLTKRIDSIEDEMIFLRESVKPVNPVNEDIDVLSEKLDNECRETRKTNTQLQSIAQGLKGTPGYNAREQFTCGSCGSKGYLAIPMRCTECGTEGWWGWHPRH